MRITLGEGRKTYLKRYKIAYFDLATEDIYDIARASFSDEFELITLDNDSLEERINKAKDADFILTGPGEVSAEVIKSAKKLKLIQNHGVGFEKIDVDTATEYGIEVCINPEGTIVGVAEHTILLILAVYKKLIRISKDMYEGKFPQWEYRTQCFEIYGKTVGFVGFGRIAREVAKRLQGFEPNIIFFDKYVNMSKEEQNRLNVKQMESLDELLALSDIVSVHMPSNNETKQSVNKAFFEKMKRTAIFINTSRGNIVNEEDFFEVMNKKIIAGAGIDVYPKEPLPKDNNYLKLENVTLTPHCAAGTIDALKRKMFHCSRNISRYINGEETLHSLNKEKINIKKRKLQK